MKILFVLTPPFNPNAGGVQRTTFKLGMQFTLDGHDIAYFSTSNEGQITPTYGKLIYAKESGSVNNSNNVEQLKNFVREYSPDIVVNQMPPEFNLRTALFELKSERQFLLIGCLRNSLFKMKLEMNQAIETKFSSGVANLLVRLKIAPLFFSLWKYKFKNRLKDILDKHDLYVVLTKANIEELRFYVGNYKQEKVKVISNSIPELAYAKEPRQKILLHVGRIEIEQKRSDLLLDVWKEVASKAPDWSFVIIGQGRYLDELKNRIAVEQIKNVEVKGRKDPKEEFLSSQIFMMPSAFEGFPNTLLEAQSHGLASLAFDSYPAVSEIVNHRKDAILVPPYDVNKMAEEILMLIGNSEQIESMREKSYENVSKFLISNVKEDWYKLFKEYIGKI